MASPPAESIGKPHKRLLSALARGLCKAGVVKHPCWVGLARLDVQAHMAQYVCLFVDWNDAWSHWIVGEDGPRGALIREFKEELRQLLPKQPARPLPEAITAQVHDFLHLADCEPQSLIREVSQHLKDIRFYLPATEILYKRAQAVQQRHAFMSFTSSPSSSDYERFKNREVMEAANACTGNWALGCILESLCLCTKRRFCLSTLFLRNRLSKEVFAVVAACDGPAEAERMSEINDLLRGYPNFTADPFCDDTAASEMGDAAEAEMFAKKILASFKPPHLPDDHKHFEILRRDLADPSLLSPIKTLWKRVDMAKKDLDGKMTFGLVWELWCSVKPKGAADHA